MRNKKQNVRDHSEERDWLLRLGGGNIFFGVQNLLKEEEDQEKSRLGRKEKKKNKRR